MKRWLEIRAELPTEAMDLLSNSWAEIGCKGVIAAERVVNSFVEPDPSSWEDNSTMRAFFPFPSDLPLFLKDLEDRLVQVKRIFSLPGLLKYEWRELDDEDWARDWQQHFSPCKFGPRLVIRPTWREWQPTDNEKVITLDPGQAFGTGTHATTSLCLEVIADFYETPVSPKTVLDVGTGSGILAMAAAALGAERVVACEIDPVARAVAVSNIKQNSLERFVSVSSQPLIEIEGDYALVLANILAAENIRLSHDLFDRVKLGGFLVLSGILNEQEPQISDCFLQFPLTMATARHREGWSCMVYRRHG